MIVHGTILIDCDIRDMVRIVSEFYELGGDPTLLREETMISLANAASGQDVTMETAVQAFANGYESAFGTLMPSEITALELARAEEKINSVLL